MREETKKNKLQLISLSGTTKCAADGNVYLYTLPLLITAGLYKHLQSHQHQFIKF